MVVFMTTPRDQFIKVIEEILCEDTVFQSTAVSTHIVQVIIRITLMFLLIGIPLNNLVTITCFPPLALPTIAAGGAACVSFATVVGEAAAGTDGGLSDAATFELSVATTES